MQISYCCLWPPWYNNTCKASIKINEHSFINRPDPVVIAIGKACVRYVPDDYNRKILINTNI